MFLRRILQVAAATKSRQIAVPLLQRQQFVSPQISLALKNYSKYIEDDEDDFPKHSQGRRQYTKNNTNRSRDYDDDLSSYRPQRRQFNNYSSPNYKKNFVQRDRYQQRGGGFGNNRNGMRNNNSYTDNQLSKRSWENVELVEFKKDFYEPHPNTVNRSNEEVEEFRKKHEITVSRGAPNPILSIDELNMPDYAVAGFKRHNFTELTPIQAQGWPIVLSGKNLVGVAQTG